MSNEQSKDGNGHIDFEGILSSPSVDPEHQWLADFMRENYPHMLRIQMPEPGDDLPVGAAISEIDPVALLRNIRWFLSMLDTPMRGGELSAEWEAVREKFLANEEAVFFNGRRHKYVPSEGTPLVIKVETFLMEKTKRNSVDGSFKFPSMKQIIEEVNRCPELLQQKRKVLKGGNKRRLYTARNLYSQLEADGHPLSVIKVRVKANYA